MQYDLIFDVTQSGYRNWTFPAVGLVFVAVGIFLFINRARLPQLFPEKLGPKDGAKLAYFVLAFSVLWTTVAFVFSARDYLALRKAIEEGNANIVEGRVQNFVSIPGKNERFTVCGADFSYSEHRGSAGFNRTNGQGGPVREGIWVRIAHLNNTIARLEVARGDVDPNAKCHPSSRGPVR